MKENKIIKAVEMQLIERVKFIKDINEFNKKYNFIINTLNDHWEPNGDRIIDGCYIYPEGFVHIQFNNIPNDLIKFNVWSKTKRRKKSENIMKNFGLYLENENYRLKHLSFCISIDKFNELYTLCKFISNKE